MMPNPRETHIAEQPNPHGAKPLDRAPAILALAPGRNPTPQRESRME